MLNPLSTFQAFVKLAVCLICIDRQASFMNLYRKDFLKSLTPEKRERAGPIYRKYTRLSNFFCNLAVFVNYFCVTTWMLLPVIRSKVVSENLHFELKVEGEKVNKILGGWYPFPFGESPWYEGVFVYEFAGAFWETIVITFFECMQISLAMMLGAHLSVLGFFISEVKARDVGIGTGTAVEGGGQEGGGALGEGKEGQGHHRDLTPREELLLYIKDHQMVMKVGDEFKDMYNLPITLQLGFGLLILTISIFHFIFAPKGGIFILKFLLYCSYEFTEIVLYCYCGNFLETVSEDFAFNVYCSEWYKLKNDYRKSGLMIMARAMRPLSIIAVRLYPVNHVTLLSMLQFSFSTSALLSRLTQAQGTTS
uniref:Odorant receptor n=1 Tax=Yemma signatus TaxID=300820 RepID=A0A385H5X4_9HEMI|nr:odorant receptor [Yemma signatus]